MAATRADDRAHGVGRSPAPLFVPRCRARDVRRSTEPEDGQLQGGFGVLRLVRRVHRRGSAGQDCYPVRSACTGTAAHRGTDRRRSLSGASSRRSCAADGGTVARRSSVLRQVCDCSRAGYRSAQDLHRGRPYARGFACYAAGRTAGGSADDHLLSYDCALMAQRTVEQNVDIPAVGGIGTGGGPSGFLPGQSSSVTAEQIVEIPVPRPDVAGDLQGFPVDRVQQRFRSRSPSFLIQVEVKIFSQSRALQRLPRISLDKLVKGFFALFPKIKKVRHNLRARGRNCLRTRAHGRRRLMTRPWCLRRRRKRRRSARRTLRWITWSTMTVCGGASGFLLASSIAGGWPLLMGHRLVTPSGGRRGSLAEGQGEVLGIDSGYMVCVSSCAYAVFFFFLREGELGS